MSTFSYSSCRTLVSRHSPASFFNPLISFTNQSISLPCTLPPVKTTRSLVVYRITCKVEGVPPTHIPCCFKKQVFEELTDINFPLKVEDEELEELELLDKPSLKPVENGSVEEIESEIPDKVDILENFYKFMKPFEEENDSADRFDGSSMVENEKINVEYYDPRQGDLAVGVVVSGNAHKLDVNVGADLLGTMLTKEVLPLYDKEMGHLLWDAEKDAEFLVRGKVGIVKNDDAMSGEPAPGKPVVEPGTVLFAEVLGRTLGGRPLLSTRRLFRQISWYRVRQIKQLNEPLEVKITEWNTGGLLTRIEGLRAFLPKTELINRVNNFTELKENVGRRIYVQITRINEDTNDLILSEKEAWAMMHLQEGSLLNGTVKKIFSYGAQIRIEDTNRSGLLHISKISRERVGSVSDIFAVEEEIKVLVIKSTIPDKISLSIADLESEPGLILSDKKKVFSDAESMAKKYRQKISSAWRKLEAIPTDNLLFEDEDKLYANWGWFKFEREDDASA